MFRRPKAIPTLGSAGIALLVVLLFLLYMPLTSPHTPLSVNEQWRGKSGLNTYADLVMETDAVIGLAQGADDYVSSFDDD